MSDFSNAKVGDRVYCLIYGEGVICSIVFRPRIALCLYGPDEKCFKVEFNIHQTRLLVYYTSNGYKLDGNVPSIEPTLYWVKPEIIEKKRKVKKSGWVNIYESQHCHFPYWSGNIFQSKEEALNKGFDTQHLTSHIGKLLDTIQIEFEVEE